MSRKQRKFFGPFWSFDRHVFAPFFLISHQMKYFSSDVHHSSDLDFLHRNIKTRGVYSTRGVIRYRRIINRSMGISFNQVQFCLLNFFFFFLSYTNSLGNLLKDWKIPRIDILDVSFFIFFDKVKKFFEIMKFSIRPDSVIFRRFFCRISRDSSKENVSRRTTLRHSKFLEFIFSSFCLYDLLPGCVFFFFLVREHRKILKNSSRNILFNIFSW